MITIIFILYFLVGYPLSIIKFMRDNWQSYTFYPYTYKQISIYNFLKVFVTVVLSSLLWPVPLLFENK